MYPLGVPTLGDIMSSISTASKIYQEARDLPKKVTAAIHLLESFDVTLSKLEQATEGEDGEKYTAIRDQIHTARAAWSELDHYLGPFKRTRAEGGNKAVDFRAACRNVKWVIDSRDRKVSDLQEQVEFCLQAVIPSQLSDMQNVILKLATDLAGIRSKFDAVKDQNLLHSSSQALNPTVSDLDSKIDVPCWRKKGRCPCRCHAKIQQQTSRYVSMELVGLQAVVQGCNHPQTCNARQYGLQIRIAGCQIGLPFAFTAAVKLQNYSWLPKFTLTTHRVCRYTAPGFVILWELESTPLVSWSESTKDNFSELRDQAIRQKVADFKHLLEGEQASFEDVDPEGKGYLAKLLQRPWELDVREEQWELVEFLIRRSPETMLKDPSLLFECAHWIGEGPHMDMLQTVLNLGLDPAHLDVGLFRQWPEFSSPNWIAEDITPDPMFVEWIRNCLKIEPGFAGCDVLTETLLHESIDDFERTLRTAKGHRGGLSTPANALGQTAVHLGIILPKRLEKLLEAGADPNCVDAGGFTPLMYAAAYGISDSVLCLVKYGADLCLEEPRYRRNFICYTMRRRHLHVVRKLLDFWRSEGTNQLAQSFVDTCMRYHYASRASYLHVETTQRLLDMGADADITVADHTLMHLAKSEQETQPLMRGGFTAVDAQTIDRKTVLMHVVSLFDRETTSWLLKHEIATQTSDVEGRTALHYLWSSKFMDHIDFFGDHTDMELKQWHFGRHASMVSCLHLLLRNGASVLTPDCCQCACSSGGCTPLTFALHRTFSNDFPPAATIRWIVIDLLNAVDINCGKPELAGILHAIMRYRSFEEQNLEHTCCRAKMPDDISWGRQNCTSAEIAEMRKRQIDFKSPLANPESAHTDKIVAELARLFHLYERRHLAEYRASVVKYDQWKKKWADPISYEVNYAKDTFCKTHHVGFVPRICKLDMIKYKEWLHWCKQKELKLDFPGKPQYYVDKALRACLMLEAEMERLRAQDAVEIGILDPGV